MDDQSSPKLGPVPTSLVLRPCACVHIFVPRVRMARKRIDYRHCIHGTIFPIYTDFKST